MKGFTFVKITDDINSVKSLFPDIQEEKFNELIKLDPTYRDGSNSLGTYGKWILNLYKKGNLKEEDFYKVPEYLQEFEKKKKAIQNKDINYYKSLPDLARLLSETKEPEQSQNQLKKAISRTDITKDADFIGDFGEYVCYSPKTYEASCKLGKNTRWCTATNSSDGYYNHYTSKGPLFIFIDKSTGQAEYQFHFPTQSFMDKNDDDINLAEFIEKNPKCQEFITTQVTNTLNEWAVDDIIELLGPVAIKFIDIIKHTYDNSDYYQQKKLLSSIIQNNYIANEFAEELNKILRDPSNDSIVHKCLFDKEKREKYKNKFIRWFDLQRGKIIIANDTLARYLYSYGNIHNLDNEFIEACLYDNTYDYFYLYFSPIGNTVFSDAYEFIGRCS